MLPQDTPDWIWDFLYTTPHGDWIQPIALTPKHPMVTGHWVCTRCNQVLKPEGHAIIMPFSGDGKTHHWIVYHRDCSLEMMGIEKTPLLRFYASQGTDAAGRNLDDYRGFTVGQMEGIHDFIQWMFPLPEPSQWNPDAPLLTPHDVKRFSEGAVLKAAVTESRIQFQGFLQRTTAWHRPSDHNHLRITRALKFLTLVGHVEDARQLFNYCWETHPGVPARTEKFWREALDYTAPWVL